MTKLVAICVVLACLTFESSEASPRHQYDRYMRSRSIPEKADGGPQGIQEPKGGPGPKEGYDGLPPKDLLNGPKGLESGGYEGFEGGKGVPKYGNQEGGPESLPGPFGPESELEGLNFGPEGPCMDKRCNPFRTRRPGYRSYLKQMRRGQLGPYGPGPQQPGFYYPQQRQPLGPPPPVMTEIIIIRKVPILLSKLLIEVSANPDKFKKGEYPKPGYEKDEYPKQEYPKPGYEKPGKDKGPGFDYEDEIQPKDQPPYQKKEGYEPKQGYESKEGFGEKKLKDKEFDEAMGAEEELSARSAGGAYGGKELKRDKGDLKKEEAKLKFSEKEYLEKPGELEPRGGGDELAANLAKEKELELNKISSKY